MSLSQEIHLKVLKLLNVQDSNHSDHLAALKKPQILKITKTGKFCPLFINTWLKNKTVSKIQILSHSKTPKNEGSSPPIVAEIENCSILNI